MGPHARFCREERHHACKPCVARMAIRRAIKLSSLQGQQPLFRSYAVRYSTRNTRAHLPPCRLRVKREAAMGGLLKFLTTFCPNLWCLDLSQCYNISEAQGVHYPTSIHTLILEKCTEVAYLFPSPATLTPRSPYQLDFRERLSTPPAEVEKVGPDWLRASY